MLRLKVMRRHSIFKTTLYEVFFSKLLKELELKLDVFIALIG